MTGDDFIDRLEHELRRAARRRVRLELARVPRPPVGAAVLAVAAVIAAAVAVPVLAAHSGSPATRPAGRVANGGGSVVVGCHEAVSGLVPAGTGPGRSRGGTVTTGPIAWGFLRKAATAGAVYQHHFVAAPALVSTRRDVSVTVTIPAAERRAVALAYPPSGLPRIGRRVSQGVSSVTFTPCRTGGESQFVGGFIVMRPGCEEIVVQASGPSLPKHYFIPLGRSCSVPAAPPPDNDLNANGIGLARFGEDPKTVIRKLNRLFGRTPTRRHFGTGQCGIDGEVDWPGLETLFHHRRFVGYSYGPKTPDGGVSLLATRRGLRVGETVREARRIYGRAFRVSAAQGGSWSVRTSHGVIDGFLSDVTHPGSRVLTIEAGNVGCPALSP